MWSNILLYAVVVLLAAAANFFEPDYMAQVPIRIGISAYDSAFAAPILERYSDLIMEKGGGDIIWRYFGEDEDPAGCDFYLMTSIQARDAVDSGMMKISLAGSATDARSHSFGVVIARGGTRLKDLNGGKFIFTSRYSASGFLSPLSALIDQGVDTGPESEDIFFTGCRSCDEKVVYGVLFGRYSAGGISLDRFRKIESLGGFDSGELSVLLTGPSVQEIFLVASAGIERWKEKGFLDRLPSITEGAPPSLKNDLVSIGIAGFIPADENSLEFLDKYFDRTAAGSIHHFP
ncbi:MAG: PhnD/SsuA/transferrin family substrate-binding protein [Candidatus Krumholzibacteriota bacterium]|nr:PhnD/SsuA/transferrin family substrate-binding protein [Candidatus Krumholzibacteriota bacterium]